MYDRTWLISATRAVHRGGDLHTEVTFQRLGWFPEGFVGPAESDRIYLHIGRGFRPELPAGFIRSEMLKESIELEQVGPSAYDFGSVVAEWKYPRNHAPVLELIGDPIAALAFKCLEPDLEWLQSLDRRQACPLCKGTAYFFVDVDEPAPFNFALLCGRLGCGFEAGQLNPSRSRRDRLESRRPGQRR